MRHDWLKNQYMPALGKWLNILDERVEDPEFAREYLESVWPEWEVHQPELLALAMSFEVEMSPRILFEYPPLCNCDDETRTWLGNLMHELWLQRYPVREWVSAAVASLEAVQMVYQRIRADVAVIAPNGTLEDLRQLRSQFGEFRLRCQDLGTALGEFPAEVLTT